MRDSHMAHGPVVALAGGVGGAKLADGLYQRLAPDSLSVIVNTADDFELYGLRISPDADTVLYTLAGLANPETGWGIAGDTFATLEMLRRYGEDTWFLLGDRDFATHIARTQRLRMGATPTQVSQELTAALGVRAALLPMSDHPVATYITTPDGERAFQDYFVRRRHTDPVHGVRFAGVEQASVTPAIRHALTSAHTIIFCPSNPLVSIGPILAVQGMRELLRATHAPKVAVSPLVNGHALKGPADTMLSGLGYSSTSTTVAELYRDLLSGIVIDRRDAHEAARIEALGVRVLVTDIVMTDNAARQRLADETLQFADHIASAHS